MNTQTEEAPAVEEAVKDLENTFTPTGKALTQFLQRKRNGAKLTDILTHLKREFRNSGTDPLMQNMTTCLEAGTNYGFLERKGSRYCVSRNSRAAADDMSGRNEQKDEAQSQPSDRCRRRRRRRRCRRRRRRRRSCRCPRRR
ncbi:uncharacterized protein LOC125240536 [Leguminivora glycinivorella]|uniref:uncharacterized protein LOC125240536 n=1 Tax=Leguminivora glycinivorella TaxID=1035111 RepID=UPI00200D1CBF|nr:uncharacterized protein LOC125240536 [Leguminivora glycinivorella]